MVKYSTAGPNGCPMYAPSTEECSGHGKCDPVTKSCIWYLI